MSQNGKDLKAKYYGDDTSIDELRPNALRISRAASIDRDGNRAEAASQNAHDLVAA
jgi:hypothetical protein